MMEKGRNAFLMGVFYTKQICFLIFFIQKDYNTGYLVTVWLAAGNLTID